MTNYDTLKEYEAHKEPLPRYDDIKRLQEQINEANELIKDYVHDANDCFTMGRIRKYLEEVDVK